MQKLTRPILVIIVALLVLGGSLWVVDPTSGLFSLMTPAASAKEDYRYAAIPAGWDKPAGSCVVCHSLEKDGPLRVAPGLWGIVDAPKARAKGYGYSQALATAGGTWTRQDLDSYLANPDKFLPGTKKTIIGLPNAQERADIVAYLAKLKD
jgi:cytochrome c